MSASEEVLVALQRIYPTARRVELRKSLFYAVLKSDSQRFKDDEDIEFFTKELRECWPSIIPDLWMIDVEKREITWFEVDDKHRTDNTKIESIANLSDYLMNYLWAINLVIYRLDPIPTRYYAGWRELQTRDRFKVCKSQMIEYLNIGADGKCSRTA